MSPASAGGAGDLSLQQETPTYFPDTVTDYRRLSALAALDVLDTAAEAGFDDAVALACQLCETPIPW